MNLTKCNVAWDTPSTDSLGSMPLGNGDLGANAWVTDDGRIHLLLSKTDAWDDTCRLVKLGKLTIESDAAADAVKRGFRHELELEGAQQVVVLGPADAPTFRLRLWADANRPVIWFDFETPGDEAEVRVTLSTWRTERRELSKGEAIGSMYQDGVRETAVEHPDTMLEPPLCGGDQIGLCHRNTESILPGLLHHQQLEDLDGEVDDPLENRTFGGAVFAKTGGVRVQREAWSQTLTCSTDGSGAVLGYATHCERTSSLEAWGEALQSTIDEAKQTNLDAARGEHEAWWRSFWDRSFIDATGDEAAEHVTRVYQLQRYVTACAGRGAFPIKFNGSIFNVDGPPMQARPTDAAEPVNADFRRWGGGYWFQNTRLIYWSMLAAGDTEMMRPWFELFGAAAPLCRHRVKKHLGLDGLFFPETMTLWGTMLNNNYGFDRPADLNPALALNRYIRRYWQGGLELSTILLEYLDQTGDEAWWQEQGYPLIRDVIAFYQGYYDKRDEHGKVLLEPAQSLETWHVATNPTPDIAGLRHVIGRLLRLPAALLPEADRAGFEAYFDELPEIPVERYDEEHAGRLVSAERYDDLKNMENCDLYAVFPYPQGALGGELNEQAVNAWPIRRMRNVCGWMQDALHAAMLGRAEEAAQMLCAAWVPEPLVEPQVKWKWLLTPQNPQIRFPGFFGPNFDWVPDQDHSCVNAIALQKMCLQTQHDQLRVLPAWPARWNVRFRLHAPQQTVVECAYVDGEVRKLTVTPESSAEALVDRTTV